MPNTYTAQLRFVKQEVGANDGVWGGNLNEQAIELIDEAISGIAKVDVSSSDVTLTALNGTTDESRMAVLEFFGGVDDRAVTLPALNKLYLARNVQTGQKVTLKTAIGATRTVDVLAETSVWVHVTDSGDVFPTTVPVSIGTTDPGGVEISGRFITPAFEDEGDLDAKLLTLGATNGVRWNAGSTDKPIAALSESGLEIFKITTEDAEVGENASIALGATAIPLTLRGPLDMADTSSVRKIRMSDQVGSLLLVGAGDQETGPTITLIGDQDPTVPANRGSVEIAASAGGGLTPDLLITGFTSETIDGGQIWHAGNDGDGSGLDADLLGGEPSNDYLLLTKTNATQTAQGSLTVNGKITCKEEMTSIDIQAQEPELRFRHLDGASQIIKDWYIGLRSTDQENLTFTTGGGRIIRMELDGNNSQLYRGEASDNDPYISLNGPYMGTNGGPKGYLELGGIIVQYGSVTVSSGTFANVDLNIAFPTACRSVVLGMEETGGGTSTNMSYEIISNSRIRIHNQSGGSRTISWMAMGD